MSLLVLLLPPRDRLGARGAGADGLPAARVPSEWSYVLSHDGRSVTTTGQAAVRLLPPAERLVLVLAEADVAWHRVNVPKAPPTRLRAALGGVLEDHLLEDDGALHLALGPDTVPGRLGWVAATDARRLTAALAALDDAGRPADAVVASAAPGAPRGHFHVGGDVDGATVADDDHPWLTLVRPDGVWCVRLAGGLVKARLPADALSGVRWSATPSAANAAEKLLSRAMPLMSDGGRALEAAQGNYNLMQFELAPRHRGSRALRDLGKQLLSREWRAVRWGLAALVGVQLVGLNAHAWQQRQALQAKREAMSTLLRTAHPGVKVVLDAPVQMLRETERLRAAAGRAGEGDLEALLGAAAQAWPDGLGPAQNLRFEPGSLTLAAPGWGQPQVQQFRDRLRAAGYGAEFAEGRVVVARAANRGAP